MTTPHRTTSDVKFSHALTGPYLPTPGKVPGWPFTTLAPWKIDVDGAADEWVRGLIEWRQEHLIRIGFDDTLYRDPELKWAQSNFVHTLLMVEDRYFYDPDTQRYTVDRYLDDLTARYGGVDSVLIWYIYPNIGIDDRNQFDIVDALPGGLEALKGIVAEFHARGVKVFLPTMPWDNGTRDGSAPDWERIADLVAETGADGINGDTYSGVPRAFHVACEARGRRVILQPESTAQAGDHHLSWNLQSWTKRIPDETIPTVVKLKWLEPRHIINIENRWSRNRTSDLQHAFFNGIGYVAWENVFGFVNRFTDRDAETLRRVATVQREFAAELTGPHWRPYERTAQIGIFASRWPGAGRTLWTLINRQEYVIDGEQLSVPHTEGAVYYDLWNGKRIEPRVEGDRAILSAEIAANGFGAFLADTTGADFSEFLATMRQLAAKPLSSFSAQWRAAPQELVPIEPTRKYDAAPEGMIAIPAASFDFRVRGLVLEGYANAGVDVQYPWEDVPRRAHRHRLDIAPFAIDRHPVTNAQFKAFLDSSDYEPRDRQNFLAHWVDGAPRAGWENRPVTWIGIEDARAYAAWAGKRLPHEWEWQYAAQGNDGRRYPWGDDWRPDAVPEPCLDRRMPDPPVVGSYPAGASPFGVEDLVGTIWQWTNEYRDERIRAAVLRGGSAYQPQTSHWYFPQAYALDEHGKYLLMAPAKDRSAGIGFRCAVDL